ncbi:MAG: PKD domain-containing protein [Flavobacteriales bacterium]
MQTKGLQLLLFALIGYFFAPKTYAQCLQSVDFNDWSPTGDSTGGSGCTAEWSILNNGSEVNSLCNTNFPKMYVGPDTLINVRVTGSFRSEDSDDDFLGFVFGFKETYDYAWSGTSSMNHEYYLFDWKKSAQTWTGYSAAEGLSLNRVDGTFQRTLPDVFPSFWEHTNSSKFSVLQSQFGSGKGWIQNQTYDFELLYTPTRALIMIDGDTVFDLNGCFEPGLFGFYNFSQQSTRYWNFNHELYVDFRIQSSDLCFNDTAKFTLVDTSLCSSINALSNIDSFYWDFGDGVTAIDTNPVHQYSSPGLYTVSLIAFDLNGCSDTAQHQITVYDLPDVSFSFNEPCHTLPTVFADSTNQQIGSIQSWDWNFGDGTTSSTLQNPTHTYSLAGAYQVVLSVKNEGGCVATLVDTVKVNPNPVAVANVDIACDERPVVATNVTQSNTAISSVEWDFNNDGFSDANGDTVSFIYSTHGQYDVRMIVIDENGCSDTTINQTEVYPNPKADFFVSDNCFKDETQFIDSSKVVSGNILSWNWTYSGASPTGVQNPSVIMNSPGTHSAQLVVTSDGGCSDTALKSFSVYYLPVAQFVSNSSCENEDIEFNQLSTSQSGSIIKYHWKFGDGGTSILSSATYDYTSAGLYAVELYVETEFGCKDSLIRAKRIYPAPVASILIKEGSCEGKPVEFIDNSQILQSTPGGDDIISWNWKLDEEEFNTQDAVLLPSDDDTIFVTLLVVSNYGCADSLIFQQAIYPQPIAEIDGNKGCTNQPTILNDASTIGVGGIVKYRWFLDGAYYSDSSSFENVFTEPGKYEVEYIATSDQGCSDTITRAIQISPSPEAGLVIIPDSGCSPLKGQLLSQSTFSEHSLRYAWYVDDQLISTDQITEVTLINESLTPLTHNVRLAVITDDGCSSVKQSESPIVVFPSPEASYLVVSESDIRAGAEVSFENLTVGSTSQRWVVNDTIISLEWDAHHIFKNAGIFQVGLNVMNEFGCVDRQVQELVVSDIQSFYIPSAFTPNGDGDNDFWKIYTDLKLARFEMVVWDRWGTVIFDSSDSDFAWNGKLKDGSYAPTGSYIYNIIYFDYSSQVKEITGELTLIR